FLLPLYSTSLFLFFFIVMSPTDIYTLSLHDALPISFMWGMINALATSVAFIWGAPWRQGEALRALRAMQRVGVGIGLAIALLFIDRKSTRLNSSHLVISYAVFCLKKKKKNLSIILLL